ncbi:hypothetical protein PBCV1_a072L [Paramecium bursaria Chlorella virus 1]|uniref:Uncharacterized protein n=1 Tax=Paramecium bursaria Chlorella virus 1 TaxID=10506 RepID=Q89407_PBCV1|nr:hypothetical protein PBCV1_a072L [Paramecium bursaria Chlorella virus 1]AAC96440.1 hypothetical protein [Paramecium bursaria Chlorella virus 1]
MALIQHKKSPRPRCGKIIISCFLITRGCCFCSAIFISENVFILFFSSKRLSFSLYTLRARKINSSSNFLCVSSSRRLSSTFQRVLLTSRS